MILRLISGMWTECEGFSYSSQVKKHLQQKKILPFQASESCEILKHY